MSDASGEHEVQQQKKIETESVESFEGERAPPPKDYSPPTFTSTAPVPPKIIDRFSTHFGLTGSDFSFVNLDDKKYDKAAGAFFGAILGDALGTSLEKLPNITDQDIQEYFNQAERPMFISDDGELSMALAYGLIEGKGLLNLNQIARSYGIWIHTNNETVGRTTKKAFSNLLQQKEVDLQKDEVQDTALLCYSASLKENVGSLSNGSLMRASPFAIWAHKLKTEDLEKAARLELSLTHPNRIVHQAGICYSMAIGHLINNFQDMRGAYLKVKNYVETECCPEVVEWWSFVEKEEFFYPKESIGNVKIAWIATFIYLKREEKNFAKVMDEVIRAGGDFDTNACIVGGVIGAAVGLSALPKHWVKAIIEADVTKGEHPRPVQYQPSRVLQMISDLLRVSPLSIIILPSPSDLAKSEPLIQKVEVGDYIAERQGGNIRMGRECCAGSESCRLI